MRCLYCGIRLRIRGAVIPLQHCPECSMRIEGERIDASLLKTAALKSRALKAEKDKPLRARSAAAQLSHH